MFKIKKKNDNTELSSQEPATKIPKKEKKQKKEKTEKQKQKERNKRIKEMSDMLKLIPIITFDPMRECFITNDDKYVDIVQIIAKDLSNVGRDVTHYDAMVFEKLYKIYKDDFKVIFMDYPVDVFRQIKYFKGRMNKPIPDVFVQYLKEKIAELEYLEQHRNNREFFIIFYSNTLEESFKNKNIIIGTLDSLAKEIDIDKKIRIFNKLANKNIQGQGR